MENPPLEEKTTLETTPDCETQENVTIQQDSNPEQRQSDNSQPETSEAQVMDLVKLCKIANRPELLVHWLERHMTVAEAQESLLKERESQPDIASAHFQQKTPENPLIQAAKKRI